MDLLFARILGFFLRLKFAITPNNAPSHIMKPGRESLNDIIYSWCVNLLFTRIRYSACFIYLVMEQGAYLSNLNKFNRIFVEFRTIRTAFGPSVNMVVPHLPRILDCWIGICANSAAPETQMMPFPAHSG